MFLSNFYMSEFYLTLKTQPTCYILPRVSPDPIGRRSRYTLKYLEVKYRVCVCAHVHVCVKGREVNQIWQNANDGSIYLKGTWY